MGFPEGTHHFTHRLGAEMLVGYAEPSIVQTCVADYHLLSVLTRAHEREPDGYVYAHGFDSGSVLPGQER